MYEVTLDEVLTGTRSTEALESPMNNMLYAEEELYVRCIFA